MSELCHNCGAELFAGQQYCRRCGVAVASVPPQGEAPTQLFEQGPEPTTAPAGGATGAAHVATAPLGAGQHTDLFAGGQMTARQPPLAAFQQTSRLTPPAPPRRKGRALLWVVLILVALVFGGAALVIAFIVGSNSGPSFEPKKVVVVKKGGGGSGGVPAPHAPPAPADLAERIKDAIGRAGVPLPVDEADAEVGDEETVISQSYKLADKGTLTVKGMSGDVSVVGTDGDEVEVEITKRGGSPQERNGVPVLYSKTDDALSFFTAAPGGKVKVAYEIKVPRRLGRLELSVENGTVKVDDFAGAVEAEARNGRLNISAEGPVKGKVTNGDVVVGYGVDVKGGPQEYSVTNGSVTAFFAAYPKTEVNAQTTNGTIEIDPVYRQIQEKRGGGMRAVGRLREEGGAPLTIKVSNGNIKLKQ
ncbi:MAG TPA: hypothetical protein VGX48_17290 [Pyrinomonadaceae bacterium]|jgi:flagellar basal body-associated protein FliL|nr:hypothetical protein [Pyrinomonadaceae bacterium]